MEDVMNLHLLNFSTIFDEKMGYYIRMVDWCFIFLLHLQCLNLKNMEELTIAEEE